jgi:hypothetical protein
MQTNCNSAVKLHFKLFWETVGLNTERKLSNIENVNTELGSLKLNINRDKILNQAMLKGFQLYNQLHQSLAMNELCYNLITESRDLQLKP